MKKLEGQCTPSFCLVLGFPEASNHSLLSGFLPRVTSLELRKPFRLKGFAQ